MSSQSRNPDRSHGGPGSSHQDASKPAEPKHQGPEPGEPTNSDRSRVSGGGGERDRHHTHNPATKS
jgi:hypothetical protein